MLNLGIPGLQNYLRRDYNSSPYIPGMDMGNQGGISGLPEWVQNIYKTDVLNPKKDSTAEALKKYGFDPSKHSLFPNKEGGFGIAGLEKGKGKGGGDKESIEDVFGRYIGDTTLDSHTDKMAGIGKEAMGIKYGLDTAQKAMQQISANNVFTGQQILDSSNKYGAGVMALAGKQQPAFNTQFRGMTPLKYSFFMG